RLAGVLADVLLGDLRLVEQFALPLADRDDVGREDERARADALHGGEPHDRLPRAAREDDHAGAAALRAARVEDVGRLALVGTELERRAVPARERAEREGERSPDDVPREILDRIPDPDERLLHLAPHLRRDEDALALLRAADELLH